MRLTAALAFTTAILACPAPATAGIGQAVSVELRLDDGRSIDLYPAPGRNRAYAEAVKGAGYRIVVHNNTGRRMGLCIAVDGRNIISGAKSWLRGDERMYILDPYATQEYAGWRSAQDRINRFFFTSEEQSYAGAFDDTSAMGLVSVASYAEVQRPPLPPPIRREPRSYMDSANRCEASKQAAAAPAPAAGTGYGQEEYSPSRTVAFEPEPQPRETTSIKYEWRDTLVRLGVLHPQRPRGNRLWDQGYAPPPPRGR